MENKQKIKIYIGLLITIILIMGVLLVSSTKVTGEGTATNLYKVKM